MARGWSDGFEEVRNAVICMWIVQALLVVIAVTARVPAIFLAHFSPGFLLFIRIFSVVFTLTLYSWLIINISAGRNWARITIFVPFLISLPSYLSTIFQMMRAPQFSYALVCLQLGLMTYAMVTL